MTSSPSSICSGALPEMEQSDHLADAVLTARALDHPSPENYFRQKDVRYATA
jgi:hypothetical protein